VTCHADALLCWRWQKLPKSPAGLQILQCLLRSNLRSKSILAPSNKSLLLLQEASVQEVPDAADQSEAAEEDVDAELQALAQVYHNIAAVDISNCNIANCCCTCNSTVSLACLQDLQPQQT